MDGIHLKSSHSICYNWKIDDLLMKFSIKARLSLLPTNFTLHIWNREHDPLCPFCRNHTESMAHLMNGCHEFRNFYSRRHNRIADKVEDVISQAPFTRERYRSVPSSFQFLERKNRLFTRERNDCVSFHFSYHFFHRSTFWNGTMSFQVFPCERNP